jgi:hypothetical protein
MNMSAYEPQSLKDLQDKAIERIRKSDMHPTLKKIAIGRLLSKGK